jgi:hypothetical protein
MVEICRSEAMRDFENAKDVPSKNLIVNVFDFGSTRTVSVGTFVVMKNGFFGPVIRVVTDDDRQQPTITFDFEFVPLNEVAEDELPGKIEDIAWMTPDYVKVAVTLDKKSEAKIHTYSVEEAEEMTKDDLSDEEFDAWLKASSENPNIDYQIWLANYRKEESHA